MLANWLASGAWGQHYFRVFIFLSIALVVAILLAVWIEQSVPERVPSFVLLTKKATHLRDKHISSEKKSWLKFIITFIGVVLCGVIANYLFIALRSIGI